MARINEIKEQQGVVTTVGSFANSLQQIAAMRMVKLRKIVFSSRRFVDEATLILRELHLERSKAMERALGSKSNPISQDSKQNDDFLSLEGIKRKAIIVITSDIGLCGSYNTEIIKKLEVVMPEHPDADYFVIGHKGQNYMTRAVGKFNIKYYPYNIPEEVSIVDLKPLIGMFYYYTNIYLIYSRFVNTATREVVFMELAVPNIEEVEVSKEKEEGKYIFEPSIDDLIASVSARVRYALFRQQILDSKLSLYTAQMIAMKTAADNAQELLGELQLQYNKAKRKLVDRKIQEVQAGRSLWADE
jgi:F-type H+-transporting ATPase subunit gamma